MEPSPSSVSSKRSDAINADYAFTPVPVETIRDIEISPGGNTCGAYLADRFRLGERVVVEAGLRWDQQTYVDDSQVSPRLNMSYELGPRTTLRAAWAT